MTYSEQKTLADLLETQQTAEPLYEFYSLLINNEEKFATGAYPQEDNIEFEHGGVDISHPLLDAVAFGILWEQEGPTSYRESPIKAYFDQANGFTSTGEVIEAQPHLQIANFFKYITVDVDDCLSDGFTPPPVTYQDIEITDFLRIGVLFGAQWEIWNADELEDRLDISLGV